jgi:hypothetical protein
MEKEETITLTITLEQVGLLNAALARYWTHTRYTTDPEMQALRPLVEELQRDLVEQMKGENHDAVDRVQRGR